MEGAIGDAFLLISKVEATLQGFQLWDFCPYTEERQMPLHLLILEVFARCRQSLKLYCNKTYQTHGCLLGLGPHNSGDLETWRGVLLTLYARGSLFWRQQASDDGKHAFSMIGVRGMRQRAYREGGLEGEGAPDGLGG